MSLEENKGSRAGRGREDRGGAAQGSVGRGQGQSEPVPTLHSALSATAGAGTSNGLCWRRSWGALKGHRANAEILVKCSGLLPVKKCLIN